MMLTNAKNNAQNNALSTDTVQMVINNTMLVVLDNEGISLVSYLNGFNKDDLEK